MVFIPHTELFIDFDEDGTMESGEEVSGDLQSWSVQRGKEISQHKAAAAQLDVTLDNLDHKYSPSNTASPLYPFTLPGPNVRLREGWPYDSFDGTNATALNGKSLTVGTELGTWTADAGMEINSNKIRVTSTGLKIGTIDYGTPNVLLAARVRTDLQIGGSYRIPIFTFRYVDDNNYSVVYFNGVLMNIAEVVGGVETDVGTVIPVGVLWASAWLNNGFVEQDVYIKISGSRAEGWMQITEGQGTFSNTIFTGSLNGLSANLTTTKHGIGGDGYTSGTINGGATWDDFGLITTFEGRADLAEPRIVNGNVTLYLRAYDDFERMRQHVLFTGTTDLLPASSGDIVNRIATRADFDGGTIVDTGLDPITPAQVDTGNNQNGVPVDTGTVMGGNALDELYQIQDDEVGFAYIDSWGVLRFESATHREENDHIEAVAQWEDSSGSGEPYIREPIDWDAGIERVENQVFYKYFRFAKALATTVWFLEPDDDPQFDFTNRLHPNSTAYAIIDIAAIGEELAIASPRVLRPVIDYTIDENADGTGTDWLTPITSEIGTVSATGSPLFQLDDTGQNFQTVSNTIAGVTFGATRKLIVVQDASGNTAVAFVDNEDPDTDGTRINLRSFPEDAEDTAGYLSVDAAFDETDTPLTYDVYVAAAYVLDGFEGNFQVVRFLSDVTVALSTAPTAYVTSAKILGDKLSASVPAAARGEDSASQLTHGRRQISHDTKHIRDWETAQARAEKRIELRKDPRERFVCHMRASSKENMLELMFREVSDRITILYSDMVIDRDHFIENYRTTYDQLGGVYETRWELTRVVPDSGINFRYDAAGSTYGTATFA